MDLTEERIAEIAAQAAAGVVEKLGETKRKAIHTQDVAGDSSEDKIAKDLEDWQGWNVRMFISR